MEKFLLDENGDPQLDDVGNPIPNPDYVEPGGYQPDDAAKAWFAAETKKITDARDRYKSQAEKHKKSLDTAKTKIKGLEDKLKRAEDGLSGANPDLEAEIKKKFSRELDEATVSNSELQTELDTVKAELHKLKYDGQINQHAIGVIKPNMTKAAMLTLKSYIRYNDEDEIECLDDEGEPLYKGGDLMSIEDFINEEFPEMHPELCEGDSTRKVKGASTKTPAKREGPNPFDRENGWNRTQQATMYKNDYPKAKQMAIKAGWPEKEKSSWNRMFASA